MLTEKQAKALRFIQDFQRANNRAPSLGDLGRYMDGISRGNAADLLDRMERRGVIRRIGGAQIEVLKSAGGKTPPFSGAIPIYDARTHEIRSWIA